MSERKLTGILVDVVNNVIKPITIDDTLDNLYEVLKCDTIDIVQREINGKEYRVICDDNALSRIPIPRASLINSTGENKIYGNVLVCGNVDNKGDLMSLDENDIRHILLNATTAKIKFIKGEEGRVISDIAVLLVD